MKSSSELTINNWLLESTKELEQVGIPSARLDCLILLEDILGKPREYILANFNSFLSINHLKSLNAAKNQRKKHIPIAYLRGFAYFYGHKFKVNPHTLIPRPESEAMITLAKSLIDQHKFSDPVKIADIGCGSGCLGISLALELSNYSLDFFDIDGQCISTAKDNSREYKIKASYYLQDLLSGHKQFYNLILANLPYVPNKHTVNKDVFFEPKHAIFGGDDGLDLYRDLFKQIINKPSITCYVLTESLPPQHKELEKVANSYGYKLYKSDDFIQCFKLP